VATDFWRAMTKPPPSDASLRQLGQGSTPAFGVAGCIWRGRMRLAWQDAFGGLAWWNCATFEGLVLGWLPDKACAFLTSATRGGLVRGSFVRSSPPAGPFGAAMQVLNELLASLQPGNAFQAARTPPGGWLAGPFLRHGASQRGRP